MKKIKYKKPALTTLQREMLERIEKGEKIRLGKVSNGILTILYKKGFTRYYAILDRYIVTLAGREALKEQTTTN